MVFGKELSDSQRRWIFSVSIILVSTAFIPFLAGYTNSILGWKIGNTDFTIGAIFAIVNIYAAILLTPKIRTL